MAKKKSSVKSNESVISIFLGALVVLVVGYLVYNYFTGLNRQKGKGVTQNLSKEIETQEEKEGIKKTLFPRKYKVKEGDYLWKIAEEFYQSGYYWVDIAKENKLLNPDLIFVDQELSLPKIEAKKGIIGNEGLKTSGANAITTKTYKVIGGDNLWNIAVRACGDGFKWVKLAKVNNLANPDLVHAGNIFKISCN